MVVIDPDCCQISQVTQGANCVRLFSTLLMICGVSAFTEAPSPTPFSNPTTIFEHEYARIDPRKGQKRQGGDSCTILPVYTHKNCSPTQSHFLFVCSTVNFPWNDFYQSFPIIIGGFVCCAGVLGMARDFYKDQWDDPLIYGIPDDDSDDDIGDNIELIDRRISPLTSHIHQRQAQTRPEATEDEEMSEDYHPCIHPAGIEETKTKETDFRRFI